MRSAEVRDMSGDEAQELLLRIARCPQVQAALRGDGSQACAEIVAIQKAGLEDFQLPEPWSGRLATAQLLFLGSNPGYAPDEEYPRWSWSDEEIVDFFENRFGGGRREWVKNGRYTLLRSGEHKERWVRYWAAVRRRAGERGVASALGECVPRYLEALVAASGASVVVSLGKVAGRAVRAKWSVPAGVAVHGPVEVVGRPRLFAFLPHPNARGERSFAGCASGEELGRLRRAVGDGL
jgi:hypothetical protein